MELWRALVSISVPIYLCIKNLHFYKFKLYIKHPGILNLFKLAIPSLIVSSIAQVNVIITGSFATLFGPGSVTALNISDRTWQLPYGVFAQGMGIAMLPMLSANLAMGEVEIYKRTYNKRN